MFYDYLFQSNSSKKTFSSFRIIIYQKIDKPEKANKGQFQIQKFHYSGYSMENKTKVCRYSESKFMGRVISERKLVNFLKYFGGTLHPSSFIHHQGETAEVR